MRYYSRMALRQLARRLAPSRPAPALSFALQRNYSKVVEGLHYAESHEARVACLRRAVAPLTGGLLRSG